MMKTLASMDIGTYTARLLIAEGSGPPPVLMPLARRRGYIRLAGGRSAREKQRITRQAAARTVEIINEFRRCMEEFHVSAAVAAATGFVRDAENREEFLDLVSQGTGMRLHPVTGEEEALLSAKGVAFALGSLPVPSIVLDLGGGSTEFVLRNGIRSMVKSTPLGAALLNRLYMGADPPASRDLARIERYVDEVLGEALSPFRRERQPWHAAATGGTATALAAMHYGIPVEEILPEKMNGLSLTVGEIETLFKRMISCTLKERIAWSGLERERAEVLVPGSLLLLRILRFFRASRVVVCLSDLLEGMLVQRLEGEKHDEQGHSNWIYL